MSDIVDELRLMHDGAQWACGATAATLGQAADEIEWLRKERDRLAADLAKAHKDILPWIEDVGRLNAEWFRHRNALAKIAGAGDVVCNTYKEMAERQFAIADEALKGDSHEG